MLYPIELLRHRSTTRNAVRWTACMLTASLAFVMSSVGFLSVGKCCCSQPLNTMTQINGTPLIHPHRPLLVNRQIATILYSTRSTGLCCRSGYPPDGMAHRHDAMVTTCRPVDFSNQSAFLMKGNGRTPLRGSIFVTELAPMIWQF